MIEAVFYTSDSGRLLGFRVKGHAGSSEHGSDIVCAAVSSASLMAANTITEVLHIGADVTVKDGNLAIRIFERDADICRDILSGFKLHMLSLEEQYPQYISVNYTEV